MSQSEEEQVADPEEVAVTVAPVSDHPLTDQTDQTDAVPATSTIDLTGLVPPGGRVEVRTRLDSHRWAKGFEVIETTPDGYRLRRLTDGEELPVRFAVDDVREERRRGGNWWY